MTFVEDNEVLWLAVQKVGNPPAWQPNTNYKLGDVVVPTSPQSGQENLMFQCVGFLGKAGGIAPVFPTTVGQKVADNQVEWECVNPGADPNQLEYNKYFQITQSVVVST